jgi:translation initiation factor IF-2
MAEEQEPKKQKKTTLIKHRKHEPETDQGKVEKKKVVIVRKKSSKVRPVKVKLAAGKTDEGKVPAQKTATEKPPRTRYLGSSPREPSPFDRYEPGRRRSGEGTAPDRGAAGTRKDQETKPKKIVPASGDTWARPRRDAARGTKKPPAGRGVGGRTSVKPREAESIFRGPGKRRPGPAQPPPPKPGEEAKPGAKRFFKTKRRPAYQRKKDVGKKEKLFDVKKKTVHRINPVPKEISILEAITVSELARKMNLKASELIGKLMEMGMMVTINQQIDSETAAILADEYSCKINVVSLYDETVIEVEEDKEEDLTPRPPIVTVMGHVDHGKTKLLDAIRVAKVMESESGGITQHIGAYATDVSQGKIVFLDTPGHEAFTAMRARGAKMTDIVILVIAADDGVMPQTVEAINHAKEANVPIIVAVNKIDLPDANPEKVKQQLAEYELLPEDWGGHTLFAEISALKGTGIDNLLDIILLQAEMLELKANYNCRAQGRVLESKIDMGRGAVATVLIDKGTLKAGDSFIAGIYPGKIRAIFNDKGEKEETATPSIPVEIVGLTGLPNAGDPFHVTENEKTARQIGLKRQELKKMEDAKNVNKITLDNLYEQIQQGNVQELKVIIKGDVNGSVEALQGALEKLSTDEIRLVVIHSSTGAINDNDVLLAAASNAIVVGFHVRPMPSAQALADREKVDVRRYTVIYEAVDSIKAAMEGLLAPELREELIGVAEVRETFKVPKLGVIAGSYVNSGKVIRGANTRIMRDGIEIYSGKIFSLRRFKDDAREVESGFECGIGIENYSDLKAGDQFEIYQVKEFVKKLETGNKNDGDKKKESRKPSAGKNQLNADKR